MLTPMLSDFSTEEDRGFHTGITRGIRQIYELSEQGLSTWMVVLPIEPTAHSIYRREVQHKMVESISVLGEEIPM